MELHKVGILFSLDLEAVSDKHESKGGGWCLVTVGAISWA